MSSIDERVVRMEFDNKQFESGVGTTLSTLEKLKNSLKFKDDAFKGLQSSADSLDFSPVSNGIFQVQQHFSLFGEFTRILFQRIANRAIDLGRTLVSSLTVNPIRDGFAEYETQMNAVQTIMANTKKEFADVTEDEHLGSINAALDELNRYADRTIYNFTEMTRNIGTFTAAGVELDDSVAAIQGIANLAAVSGANAHQASNAMYQLSQALSSGVVRLMDWNSVQNASMGGQFFQDALQVTAQEFLETGREVENAAGQLVSYRTAAGITANSIQDLIAKEGGFRNSLQKGWLTSDVLLETLAKLTDVGLADYFARVTGLEEDWIMTQFNAIDAAEDQDAAISKLAQTLAETGNISEEVAKGYIDQMFLAQDAATKVKTFTQLIDTLKEALGSGWTKSIQLIIGDFKEAMELWTAVSDELSNIINDMGDTRNAILQIWHDSEAVGSGGRLDALKGLADIYHGLKAAVLAAKDAFDEIFGSLSIEESAEKLMELTRSFSRLAGSVREFLESDEFASRLKGILSGIFSVAKSLLSVVGDFLSRLSPLATGISQFAWYVFSAADSLSRLVRYFVEADDKFAFLRNLFTKGTTESQRFSRFIIELGLALDAVVSSILKIFGIDVSGTPVADFFSRIKDLLTKHIDLSVFDGLVEKLPTVTDLFSGLKSVLSGLVDVVLKVLDALGTLVSAPLSKLSEIFGGSGLDFGGDGFGVLDILGGILEGIGNAVFNFFGFISSLAPKIANAFRNMFSYLASEEFGNLIKNFTTLMGGGLLLSIKNLVDAFKDKKFGQKEKTSLADTVSGVITSLKESLGIDSMVETFTNTIEAVTGALENFQNALSPTTLLKISIAIALLAGSLVAISKLDQGGMANGIAGMTVLFGELVGAFSILSSVAVADPVALSTASSAMVKMGIAVGIMSLALKYISGLDIGQVTNGLIGIAGVLLVMVSSAMMLSVVQSDITKVSTGILVMSVALRILVTSIKYLSDLDWDSLARGLTGVVLLLFSVGVFARIIDEQKSSFTSMLSIVAAAVAIKLLASTVHDFSGMNWDELIRGLTGVGVLLLSIGVFMRIASSSSISLRALASILVVTEAVKVLSEIAVIFSSMSVSSLEKGLVSVGTLVLSLGAVLAIIGSTSISLRDVAAIFVVAQAVKTLSDVVVVLGGLDPTSVEQGLYGLAGAMLSLVVPLVAVGQISGQTLKGAVALLVIAAAIRVVVPAFMALAQAKLGDIVKGLLGLVAVLGVMAVGSTILAAIAPSIFLASAAIGAFGIACAAVGAAILLLSVAIAALGASLAVSAASIVAGLAVLATGIVSIVAAVITGIIVGVRDAAIALFEGIDDILASLGVAIHAIGDFLLTNAPYILAVVGSLMISLFSLMTSLIPAFISTVGAFVIALLQAIVTWVPSIAEALVLAVISLINSVANGIREHGQDILSAVGNIVGSIIDLVLLAIEDILRLIPGVGDFLGDQLEGARDAVTAAFSPSDLQQATAESMSGAQQGIADGGAVVTDAATTLGTETKDSFKEGLGDGSEVTTDFLGGLSDSFASSSVDLTSFTGVLGDELTLDLSGAAIGSVDSYTSNFDIDLSQIGITDLPSEIVSSLGSHDSEFKTTGAQSINNYATGIGNPASRTTARNSGASVASSGVSGASSKKDQFRTAGYYAGIGFGDGLSSTSSYVRNKAVAVANTALNSISITMESRSPSRATMRLGRYASEGFGIGMGQLIPYVEEQASKVGGGALEGLRESISHVGKLINSDMDVNPTIRPVLDLSEIQNGASAIGGMLSSRSYGVSTGIGMGAYATNNLAGITGRRGVGAPITNYNVNIDGARVNDIPAIHNATYDLLVTLQRYGEM